MGEPLRAKHCTCHIQRLDPDGICHHCGYFPKETVDDTWAKQARITGYQRPVSALDEYRKSLVRRSFGSRAA